MFNGVSYVLAKVPTLYTALTTGANASDARVYGVNSNTFVLQKNDVVEIVINNMDPGRHPFHLHGKWGKGCLDSWSGSSRTQVMPFKRYSGPTKKLGLTTLPTPPSLLCQ